MVPTITDESKNKYKPSIGKRWFLIILSSFVCPGGIAMFTVSWEWVLLRTPPAPTFGRIVVAALSFVFLAFAIGWLRELLRLIKDTKNKSA